MGQQNRKQVVMVVGVGVVCNMVQVSMHDQSQTSLMHVVEQKRVAGLVVMMEC